MKKEGVIDLFDNKYVVWFSEIGKDDKAIAGGKGANLGEIYNAKMPVPPGFVVTAQAYQYFIHKAGIDSMIKEKLSSINYEDTAQLDKVCSEIRDLIVNSKMPDDLSSQIIEDYGHLDASEIDYSKGGSALEMLKRKPEPVFVAVRSSATAEDLAEASFAGQQDSFLNVKGKDDLIKFIKKCFASLFTARATYYRNKQRFEHDKAYLAVVVQKMINSDKSGVMFSKDPSYNNENVVIEAVWGLGEGIVSGLISPDHYVVSRDLEILETKIVTKKIALTRDSSGGKLTVKLKDEIANKQVLKESELKNLAHYALLLEKHYGQAQDVEFCLEGGNIFIVQTRPITTIAGRGDKEGKGIVTDQIPIVTGQPASPGIGVGKVKIIKNLKDLDKIKTGDILVTTMTDPDMVVAMQKCTAIVTDEGGMTAHASIVSREMGIPCIVGTNNASSILIDNEIITVDGFTGKVYKGKIAEEKKKEILPVVPTQTHIKVIVDLPSFAQRAALSKAKAVGLTRVEGIIAESGKHPKFFEDNNQIKDYEEVIFKGIDKIAQYFDEVWVRTSDIRSDEYSHLQGAPKDVEANPMLGMHGIRYSLKHPELLKAEYRAMKRVAKKGKIIGLLHPQIISVSEIKEIKNILNEIEFKDAKVGVMIETPAAVQIIKELCEEGIHFISFGTNDLTQYTLAIDRGNEGCQYLYDEMHPAILRQIEKVIRVCKKYGVETSLCGQAGSRPDMAKFLVETGIDSFSVNADMAHEISQLVAKIESERLHEDNHITEIQERSKKPSVVYEELPSLVPKVALVNDPVVNEETDNIGSYSTPENIFENLENSYSNDIASGDIFLNIF